MYRILVAPVAQQILRTLDEHLVRRVGRLLAQTAEQVERPGIKASRSPRASKVKAKARLRRIEVTDGLSLIYAIDPAARTLTLRNLARP